MPDLPRSPRVGHGIRDARKAATPAGRAEGRLGCAGRASPEARGLVGDAQHRIEVRHRSHAPAWSVGVPAAGSVRPYLRRSAVLSPLAEGAAPGGFGPGLSGRRGERIRALGAAGREDDPQPRELVDANLRRGQGPVRTMSFMGVPESLIAAGAARPARPGRGRPGRRAADRPHRSAAACPWGRRAAQRASSPAPSPARMP